VRTAEGPDDRLVKSAMKASGLRTEKQVIEAGLRLLIRVQSQKKIKEYRGKLKWSGDLDRMRRDK
jgi:Arc/MetJ family transcription regulator